MFERTKAKIRLHRICKALGVEPYPEMVRYVIDRDETIFRGGRRNGKTLALIIDELVYKRIPPALLGCPMECRFCKDPDYWKMPQMRRDRFYISELAWRGYKAVGGEFMLLLLPIIYYEAKRIILDFVADFVELYRRAED